MQGMQTFMITSVTHRQQRFSMRNTKVNGRNNVVFLIMQSMIGVAWCFPERSPETGVGDAPRVDCECVCLLNIPRYIFIVWRLSILSMLDSNNPYRI
jgi:hypothetical protein